MLKEILAITGKPGLYKIVSNGKNMLVVEDITSGRRFPAHGREKIVSLGDVAMYTDKGEVPLSDVLESVYNIADGKTLDIKKMVADDTLKSTFAEVLPDYDRDHVYVSDMKKLFSWYNILVGAGYTTFSEPVAEEAAEYAAETQIEGSAPDVEESSEA